MYLLTERYIMDKKTKEITEAWNAAHQLNRIADALEEILRLVKADQERSRAYMEREKNGLPTIETDDEN